MTKGQPRLTLGHLRENWRVAVFSHTQALGYPGSSWTHNQVSSNAAVPGEQHFSDASTPGSHQCSTMVLRCHSWGICGCIPLVPLTPNQQMSHFNNRSPEDSNNSWCTSDMSLLVILYVSLMNCHPDLEVKKGKWTCLACMDRKACDKDQVL